MIHNTMMVMLMGSSMALAQGSALIFDDTNSLGGAGGLQNSAAAAATALGLTPTSHSDFGAFTADLTGPAPWDIVIVTHLNHGGVPTAGDLDAINTYLTGGGKVIFQSWNLVNQGLCAHPLFSTMQVRVNCAGDSASDLFVWDPAHGMMASSPNPTMYQDVVGFGIDMIKADPIIGQSDAVMGFITPTPSPTNGAVLPRADLQSVYLAHFPQMMGPIPSQGETFLMEVIDCMFNPGSCGDSTTCAIVFPSPMSTVSGVQDITFDVDDTQMDTLTAAFDWSSDGGATFSPASADATSPLSNPALGIPTPSTGNSFVWNSAADGVGFSLPQLTIFRITVSDGMPTPGPSTCELLLLVDNPIQPPRCVLTLPGGGPTPLSGDINVQVDASSPAGSTMVDIVLDFSSDSGATWQSLTTATGSPHPNPALSVPVGISDFSWDSLADGVGLVLSQLVEIRAIVDDGGPAQAACSFIQSVDNSQVCTLCGDCNENMLGPDILDALTAAQIAAGLLLPTRVQDSCCDVNSSGTIDVLDALFIAQAAAGLPVMLTCV